MRSLYTLNKLIKGSGTIREVFASLFRVFRLKVFFFFFPKGSLIVPFYRNSYFLLNRGFSNAIGNYYAGLLEPDDMLFLVQFLRPGDLFIDVGANIGSYTILASAVCRSNTIAFEPIPETFAMLKKNIAINGIESTTTLFNNGIGSGVSKLNFTATRGGSNHVIVGDNLNLEKNVEVDVYPLDSMVKESPLMMKIDVEGFELEVLNGAKRILSNPNLRVILIEINGLENRYQSSGINIHEVLISFGFYPHDFNSKTKELKEISSFKKHNTLYLRDVDFVKSRIV